MLGQFAWVLPDAPVDPFAPVDPVDPDPEEVLGAGVFVELLVAALAATAPPPTRTPETASTAAALRIGLMCCSPPSGFVSATTSSAP
jgi:hypothetical protein